MKPQLSICTVTHNSSFYLNGLGEDLARQSDLPHWEWLVFDNGSADDSAELAERQGARIVRRADNIGYAAAANALAHATQGAMLLLLNPDVLLPEADCLSSLLDFQKLLGSRCIVAPRQSGPDGIEREVLHPWPTLFSLGRQKSRAALAKFLDLQQAAGDEPKSGWLEGTALLLDRRLFFELGGFDLRYAQFGEDLAFSYQAQTMGCSLSVCQKSWIVHRSSQTTQAKRVAIQAHYARFLRDSGHPVQAAALEAYGWLTGKRNASIAT